MARTVRTSPAKRWIIPVLLALTAVAFWYNRPADASLRERMEQFLSDEGLQGGVIAYGEIGAAPVVIAVGKATQERLMSVEDSFRLASLSKPITAAAVLKLVEDGFITLDTTVPEAGPGITVRHLLQHSGGWDRDLTFDPIGDPASASRTGMQAPYTCIDLARHVPPTQFAPGTRYAYSNIGYCWLGHAIERASGQTYTDYVNHAVLEPRGSVLQFQDAPSVVNSSDWATDAYQALGPGGGWVGTVREYWEFAVGPLDRAVRERPSFALEARDYYGLGWRIWPDGTYSHFGVLPGAFSVVLRKNQHVMVAAFNGRPRDDNAAFKKMRRLFETLN